MSNDWVSPFEIFPDNNEEVLVFHHSDGYQIATYDSDRNEYVVRDLEGGWETYEPDELIGWCSIKKISIEMRKDWIKRQELARGNTVQGSWIECWYDNRCSSVICSRCREATSIAHGLTSDNVDDEEMRMKVAYAKLPHCPKCCSVMRREVKSSSKSQWSVMNFPKITDIVIGDEYKFVISVQDHNYTVAGKVKCISELGGIVLKDAVITNSIATQQLSEFIFMFDDVSAIYRQEEDEE